MSNKKLVQYIARNFVEKVDYSCPVNIYQIAQRLNSRICYCDGLPHTVNGATIPLKDGSYIIAIKSRQPFLNERFSIAREIAHIVLGHCAEGIIITSSSDEHNPGIFPRDTDSYVFAMELLVPLEELKYTLSDYDVVDIDKLCTLYGVAGEIINTRLNEIGLIPHNLPHTLSLANCYTQGRII